MEVELRIKEDGRVELEVKGQPGPSCVDVAKAFELLGDAIDTQRTPEYYESGAGSELRIHRRS